MMDKETYKKELVRMWDSLRTINKGESTCISVKCKECPLNESDNKSKYGCNGGRFINIFEKIEIVEKWSEEHQEKKYKLSRIEYEVLISENKYLRKSLGWQERVLDNYTFAFSASHLLPKLLKFGYYKGANLDTSIDDYLSKSVVVK